MEENREALMEEIAQLEEKIKMLPAGLQRAVYWAIENYAALEEMGKNSEMALEEIQSAMEHEFAEENYAAFTLLYTTKLVKEFRENEEL